MNIYLAFPPHWSVFSPPLALPLLTSVLEADGHHVFCRDLNIETFFTLLSQKWIEETRCRMDRFLDSAKRGEGKQGKDSGRFRASVSLSPAFPFIAAQVETALARVRKAEYFFDFKRSAKTGAILDLALKLSLVNYYPTAINMNSLKMPFSPFSTSDITEACRSIEYNPFLELFNGAPLEEMKKEEIRLLAISIASEDQVIPGFTLARLAKKTIGDLHVCVGGTFFTKVHQRLGKDIFRWVDSFIIHEGEEPLRNLCRHLSSPIAASLHQAGIPNLVCCTGKEVAMPGRVCTLDDPDQYPEPDYSQLPVDHYLSPESIYPVIASRGCYYSRCAFCGSPSLMLRKSASLSISRILENITHLAENRRARYFAFMDEALSPSFLKRFCAELLRLRADRGLEELFFTGEIRLDKAFDDADFIKLLYQAGFRKLMIGLESYTERVNRLMCKNVDLDVGKRILHQLVDHNISLHLFFIVGFPSETKEELFRGLRRLLSENILQQDPFLSFMFHAFELELGTEVHRDPERFGITGLSTNPRHDLALYCDYTGIPPARVEREGRKEQAFALLIREMNRFFLQNPYHAMLYKEWFRESGTDNEEVLKLLAFPPAGSPLPSCTDPVDHSATITADPSVTTTEHLGSCFYFHPQQCRLGGLDPLELAIFNFCRGKEVARDSLHERFGETTMDKTGSGESSAPVSTVIEQLLRRGVLRTTG